MKLCRNKITMCLYQAGTNTIDVLVDDGNTYKLDFIEDYKEFLIRNNIQNVYSKHIKSAHERGVEIKRKIGKMNLTK